MTSYINQSKSNTTANLFLHRKFPSGQIHR